MGLSPLFGDGAKAEGAQPDRRSGTLSGPEIDTVIVEMTHGFAHRLEPLTMVSYDVNMED
jgi:hypothetical protein